MHRESDIKVSVIVTTYNQEDTIARTLDSILSQQCAFPFEIQLSDDCSTDATPRICREYAERYPDIIRFNRNEVNRGCRDNYFDTLLRCNAPYISDCAGDDYWVDPLKLQKQADLLDSDPGITLVHTNWAYLDIKTGALETAHTATGCPPGSSVISAPGEIFLPVMRHAEKPFIHLCSSMYRKSVFIREYDADHNLFRDTRFPCEDLQLKALYAHEGRIGYINDVTFHYSVGHKSVSSTESHLKTFDFYLGSLRLTNYLADKYGVSPDNISDTRARMASYLFAEAFFAFDRERIAALLEELDNCHTPLPFKSRILLPATRFRPAWRITAALKSLISRWRTSRHHTL